MTLDGPLRGTTAVEIGAIGPVPFAGMVLSDLGCDVLRVTRPGAGARHVPEEHEILHRGRPAVAVDLASDAGHRTALHLVARADVLLEGFRPGVMERLGLGPNDCAAVNPRLVYARVTGWGQDGPLAPRAGHDINYLALSGALSLIGPPDGKPVPPLNLLADFGGGGMLAVAGVLAALLERARSDRGQVVDAAMVDGVGLLLAMTWGMHNAGAWRDGRGTNLLDGGAPFYDTYLCADGGYLAVGAIEPKFYAAFLDGLGTVTDTSHWPDRTDVTQWPRLRARIASALLLRDRDDWVAVFDGTDACVTPVLSLEEAVAHPHLRHRHALPPHEAGGFAPAAAPRFSRTPGAAAPPPADPAAAYARWGLRADGSLATPPAADRPPPRDG